MSVFRPATRLRSPDGRDWEIYAYRIRLPDRPPVGGVAEYGVERPLLMTFDAVLFVLASIPRLVVRAADVILASFRMLGSDEWTVQAVSFDPPKLTYTWTTSRDLRGQVLASVEGQLARGDAPPKPRNARFHGVGR